MQTIKRQLNRATVLTFLTVLLAGIQSYLLHIGTTDYRHKILSIYFFAELFIFVLTLMTKLKSRTNASIYFGVFLFEAVFFCINERPISSNNLIMIIIAILRIYIFYWLSKQLSKEVD